MTPRASGLYVGSVQHIRLRPRRHALRYRLYSLFIDLDELPQIARASRLFSYNRFNLFSLYDRDFGDGSNGSLRERVTNQLRAAGLPADGAIRLLAMPRVLGYAFNPISIFFCHAANGSLAAIHYEVHNTFGERHAYLLAVEAAASEVVNQSCDKTLHVSPFMDMGMSYRFRINPPGERFRVGITGRDDDGILIVATQTGRRVELTDAALARVFFTHPLVTLKIIFSIHWEALRLFLKGIRVRPKPPAPADFITTARRRTNS